MFYEERQTEMKKLQLVVAFRNLTGSPRKYATFELNSV